MRTRSLLLLTIILLSSSCYIYYAPHIEDVIEVQLKEYDAAAGEVRIVFNWLDPSYSLKEINLKRRASFDDIFNPVWDQIDISNSLEFTDPLIDPISFYNFQYTEEAYEYNYTVTALYENYEYELDCSETIWVPIRSDIVWYAATGIRYHRHSCCLLNSEYSTTRAQAVQWGLTPCLVCTP